jgi:hypothetical protein
LDVDESIGGDEKYILKGEGSTIESQEKYSEHETINGIEVKVYWDKSISGQCYELQLPQIEFGSEEMEKYHVYDQVLILGDDKDFAKKVFENVKNSCRIGCNVYEVYKWAQALTSEEFYSVKA